MTAIELFPDLTHCIETVAKKEYEDITRQLLAGESNAELEDRLALLRDFLETADFRELRRQSEELLLQNRKVKFLLFRDREQLSYKMVQC
jgi:hypothetical protein